MLFFAEMFGRTEVSEDYRYNLTLFQEIKRFYRYGQNNSWTLFIINVVGNIVVFIPFGMCMPRLFARCKNVILTVLLTLEFSLIIEVAQLLSRVGRFDVDDLLLNTIGGLCGYIIWGIWSGISIGGKKQKSGKSGKR